MQSCIYQGQVSHSRRTPIAHRFRYNVFMMYLDLEELPRVFDGRWFWSASRTAVARFRREHHYGDTRESLDSSIRQLVEDNTGKRPEGPIRLLTNLSYFGYCFNPISFYYCFEEDGETLAYIVSEVNSTPWGEQNMYVMTCDDASAVEATWRFREAKAMHVSPFMPMNIDYDWVMSLPGKRLSAHIASSKEGKRFFDAAIAFKRVPITSRALSTTLLRFPFMTARIILAIYWQALRLWLKRCPVYLHPNKNKKVATQ